MVRIFFRYDFPDLYKKESIYYYPSFFIGGIILTILTYELKIKNEITEFDFILYACISYGGIKFTEYINIQFSNNKNSLGILKYIFVLFFSYLMIVYTNQASSYITDNLKIQSKLFSQVIVYISAIKSFQFTIYMFIVPVTLSIFINIVKVMIVSLNWKSILSFILKMFLLMGLIMKVFPYLTIHDGFTMNKSNDFWIEKHGFVDSVLCEGNTYKENVVYSSFNAKNITDTEYLILDKRTKKYHFYKEFIGKKQPYNYYKITCDEIKAKQSELDSFISKSYEKMDALKDRINVLLKNE